MAEQFGDKSHEATPYRRQKAREEGQVAKSQDLASALLLLGSLAAFWFLGSALTRFFGELAVEQLGGPPEVTVDSHWAARTWNRVFFGLSTSLVPIFGLIFATAVLVHLVQTGFLFLPKKLSFDVSRISPLKGFGRIFSLASAMRLAFGLVKVAVVGAVAAWCLWAEWETILSLPALEVRQIAMFVASITFFTCLKIAGALLLLAILDFAFQRWKHEQDLRMTSQEVREEMKNLQGDPQVIARRKQVQRQLAQSRMSTAVPKADVVVTNPTELAVALRYDPAKMEAPIVVAKGAGTMAERIRRLALESDIPIVERKELAQVLYRQVEVDRPVPVEQYAAVAEVLKYVYELKGKTLPQMETG